MPISNGRSRRFNTVLDVMLFSIWKTSSNIPHNKLVEVPVAYFCLLATLSRVSTVHSYQHTATLPKSMEQRASRVVEV